MIKVSIIIPVYNTEKYLRECLDSVINQTLIEKEIIIVNDGSTDNCLYIIEEYIRLYPHIILINQKNKGLSGARNSGMKVATGEYIGFVDSDDIIDINMYNYLYYYAINGNADIVECGIKEIKYGSQVKNKIFTNFRKTIYNNKEGVKAYYEQKIITPMCTSIYKKELFEDLKFPLGMIYEDNYIKPLVVFKSKLIIVLSEKLYFNRKRMSSITRSESKIENFQLILMCQKAEKYLKKNDKKNYSYYIKQLQKRNVFLAYYIIEKMIKDNFNITLKCISKYTIYILLLGVIIDAKEYALRFFIIFSYFIKCIIYKKLHIGMINHGKK